MEDVGEYVVSCSDDLCFHGHGMVGAVRYACTWLSGSRQKSTRGSCFSFGVSRGSVVQRADLT